MGSYELMTTENENKDDKRYLIFNVSKESYGIDVTNINNIIQMPSITYVPCTPNYVSGIINLRDQIIPIMNLGVKLGVGAQEETKETRIIVLEVGDDRLIGIIVDAVKEVITIDQASIEQPAMFSKCDYSLISGVGKKDDRLISIVEPMSLLEREMAS